MRRYSFELLLLLSLTLLACTKSKIKTNALPLSVGELGKIHVIADKEFLSNDIKDSLMAIFGSTQPYLNMSEPYFDFSYLTPALFKSGLVMDGTLVFIGSTSDKSDLKNKIPFPPKVDSLLRSYNGQEDVALVLKDIWAFPQRILVFLSKSPEAFKAQLERNKFALLNRLLDLEREESALKNTYNHNKDITKQIKSNHSIEVKVPETYRIAVDKKLSENEGFVWIRQEGAITDLGLTFYYEPYTDTAQFQLNYQIAKRDSLYKQFIIGDGDEYVGTDNQFQYKQTKASIGAASGREYYATWTMINGFMGGPIYSVTQLDNSGKRIVTIEAFVFAPKFDKTKYMRELQGLIKTMNY